MMVAHSLLSLLAADSVYGAAPELIMALPAEQTSFYMYSSAVARARYSSPGSCSGSKCGSKCGKTSTHYALALVSRFPASLRQLY